MLKKLSLSMVLVLLAACAGAPPEPEPEAVPPPVEITEAPQPAPDAPPPDQPPPPDAPDRPPQTDSGMFRIAIAALDRAELAPRWVKRAEDAGYRTELLAVEIDGKTWHRVLLPGYESLDSAQAALPFIQQELSPDAWVTSRRRAPGSADAPADAPPPQESTEAPPPPPPEETPAN
jgi:hypothetical protein